MGWHLEAPELDDAEASALGVGAEQLVDAELGSMRVAGEVDEEVPQKAIGLPQRHVPVAFGGEAIELGERGLELVQAVVARFVDAGSLARGADEPTREQVRERRVVLPVGHEAADQVGPT